MGAVLDKFERLLARYHLWWGGCCGLLFILLAAAALYTWRVSVWWGPWRDMWEVMPFLQKALGGQAGWPDYWEQYGYSHRPLLSRWLWVQDLRWFAGSNALLIAVSLLMQGLVCWSVWAVLRRDATIDPIRRRLLLVGVMFCLLNITQVFNFLHTFDVQWFLVTGFVCLALERLLTCEAAPGGWRLLCSWCAIFVASLNNFSALVMWPVAVLLLVLLGCRWRDVLAYVAATTLYLLFYFHQLMPAEGSGLLSSLDGLEQALQLAWQLLLVFPLWYLGNPLSFQLAPEGPLQMPAAVSWLAPGLVLLLLLAALYGIALALRRVSRLGPVACLGVMLMLYGYGVGVVTAMGRFLFWDNVYALRYQNIVLLFWIGVLLWLASSVRWRNVGLFAGTLLLVLVFAVRAGWYHELLLKTGNRTRDAHLALVVGLERELSAIQATVSRAHLGPGSQYHLAGEAAFLRQRQAGPYADPGWQVPALTALQKLPVCEHGVQAVDVRGDSYARLSVDFAEPVPYELIAWFDADGNAPGLLIAQRADNFVPRLQQSLRGFTAYAGFARQLPAQRPEQLFARRAAVWCRLALRRD